MDLEDSIEIGDLVSKINANPHHVNEADGLGHRDVLEAIWMEDPSCAQFLQDQLTNSESLKSFNLLPCIQLCTETGNKTSRWSLVTYGYRIGTFMCVCVCVCVCTLMCMYMHT